MIDDHIDYGVMGPQGKKYSTFFFILGVVGALAIRLVLILTHVSQFWSSFAWYVAMISYLFFYHHRYAVEKERQELIKKYDLINKFKKEEMGDLEKNECLMLLNSIANSRVKYNLLVWYIITIITLIAAAIIDLIAYFS